MSKIIIPVEQLPPPNKDGDHVVQFRVISEDRNRISAWSNLYIIKSIGQYKPYESDVTMIIGSDSIEITWDTPGIYNYDGTSSAVYVGASAIVQVQSASIVVHNHTQNFKRHDTDVFVKWDSGYFEYHDRIDKDNTSIIIPSGKSSVRVIGLVATHGLPQKMETESDSEFGVRLENHLNDLIPLFKVFDTSTQSLT